MRLGQLSNLLDSAADDLELVAEVEEGRIRKLVRVVNADVLQVASDTVVVRFDTDDSVS